MYGETIAGRRSVYPGCGKDLADGHENTVQFFNEMHRQTLEIIEGLSDEDLTRNVLLLPIVKFPYGNGFAP